MNWKLSAIASKARVEEALHRRDENLGWDEHIVLAGFEVDPDEPDCWQLDAYIEDKPTESDRKAVRSLFDGKPPRLVAEKLPETDWVSVSQRGVEPIRAGRFHVHTPDHASSEAHGVRNFCIPAAQAFGTGHHETTAGCLVMLDSMRRQGVNPRHIADIGTGTGLLAFAALELWPHSVVTASDNDPVCEPAVLDNADRNSVRIGTGASSGLGEVTMVIADGMNHPVLQTAAPFDLLIANILAGPLIEMAQDFSAAVVPRGHIVLSGLLTRQEAEVRSAYRRAGFRLHRRLSSGDWSILWLRHRFSG